MELNVLDTLQSSFTMLILLGCSVLALTFIFERWLYLKRSSINAESFFGQFREALARGGREAALTLCNSSITPLATVIRAGIEDPNVSAHASEELMDATAINERTKLEKNLNTLGTLGNIAPLIGLFGTVIGIIRAFHALAVSGSAGPSVISAGIAEALITTAGGLVVAVPAVVFYNYFLRRVNTMMTDIESISKKVLVAIGQVS
ncbi:MAG: MotA/TolQ/ExbB proton channel family protein [Deferribacteres bacterium]|nr:MotA/TolQ/ExbB proton channel family protein [candidate division KSB1 bacterium]MCB9502703.1 MotA/TolQ/ExbB proton channel family protein [Deferribacteres bacterium]